MTIEDEARAQANEMKFGVFMDGNPFSDSADTWTDGFIEGAVWASQREPTDTEVEAAARVLAGLSSRLWEQEKEGGYTQYYIDQARAALVAALNTRENQA